MAHNTISQGEDPHPALSHADVGEGSRGARAWRGFLSLCRTQRPGHEMAGPPWGGLNHQDVGKGQRGTASMAHKVKQNLGMRIIL